jgi:glutaminyl-peptide cyclotransferase
MRPARSGRATGALVLLAFAAGCGRAPPPAPLSSDAQQAWARVQEVVACGPRPSHSPNAEKTAALLAARCQALGYAPETDTWQEETPRGVLTFRNVYAERPGRGADFVLLVSHYDTKIIDSAPLFAGANDSGSSTGLLLELLRVLRAAPDWRGPTVRFAFVDGEECYRQYAANDGLHGSRHLAARLQQRGEVRRCRAVLVLDMIGDADLKLTLSPKDHADLIARVRAAARDLGAEARITIAPNDIRDDQVPFRDLGIPSLDLIDFQYGPDNAYWHTAGDTLDKLSPASLQFAGDLTLRLLEGLGAAR